MADAQLKAVISAEDRASRVIEGVSNSLGGIQKQTEQAGIALKDLKAGFETLAIAGGIGFAAIAVGVGKIVKAGSELEQTNIAFTTMLGSAEKAGKLLAELNALALTTPFELKNIRQGAKELLAFGVPANQIIDVLKDLGNIAAGVGIDKLPNLILAFGQVRGAGKLMGTELRQFTEAGVPLLEELSKVTGYSVQQMAGNVGRMGITFDEVQQALHNLSGEGGRFENLMENQSHSLAGAYSNLQDTITKAAEQIGLKFAPMLTPLLLKLIDVVSAVSEWIQANPKLTVVIIALGAALTGIPALVGALGLALIALSAAGTSLIPVLAVLGVTVTTAGGALLATVGIIAGVVAAIALLAVGVYEVIHHWDEIKAKTIEIWDAIGAYLSSAWNNITTGITNAWEGIKNYFTNTWNGLSDSAKGWLELLGIIMTGGLLLLVQEIVVHWDEIKDAINSAMEAVKGFLAAHWQLILAIVGGPLGILVGLIIKNWDAIKNATITAWNAVRDFFVSIWNDIKNVFGSAIDWITQKLQSLISLVDKVKSAASSIGAGIGGAISGVGNFLNNNLTPRASGGSVNPNQSYLVGERGPELFTPSGYGSITRNSQLGGSGGIVVNVYGDVSGQELIDKVSRGIMNELKFNVQV